MTNPTPQASPDYLGYLPPDLRDRVELHRHDMTRLFHLSRETLRLRITAGELPAPLPGGPRTFHRWSAHTVNAFIAEQANANKSPTQNA